MFSNRSIFFYLVSHDIQDGSPGILSHSFVVTDDISH